MIKRDPGLYDDSARFFYTPSEKARRLLFYTTSCGYYNTNMEYHIERDNYYNFLICYICEGQISFTSESTTMVAQQGQICFLNCHVPHEYHTLGHAKFYWLHVEGGNTNAIYRYIVQEHGGFAFSAPNAQMTRNALAEIFSLFQNDQTFSETWLSTRLYKILSRLIDDGYSENLSQSRSPIAEAITFIKKHYTDEISLSDIANEVNMSRFHFSRRFKNEYGYSPHEYIILMRINRAKHLLTTTLDPIKNIAQSVGYSSAANFTNAFTKHVGLSPTEFRSQPQ